MTATAPATVTVSAVQTVHGVCQLAVTVRDHSSLHMTVSVDGFGVLGEMCAQGGTVSRRSRSREQDPEQERTWERAQGRAVATCGCGRDCDRDRGCHCDCDCGRAHDRARCTGVTCGLPGSARHRTIRHRARPRLLKGSEACGGLWARGDKTAQELE